MKISDKKKTFLVKPRFLGNPGRVLRLEITLCFLEMLSGKFPTSAEQHDGDEYGTCYVDLIATIRENVLTSRMWSLGLVLADLVV